MPPTTDKHSTGLAGVYAELFRDWRGRPVRVLEIGIHEGGSMWLWSQLFPHPQSVFIGIDLVIPPAPLPENCKVYPCDQNNAAGLQQIAAQHGPFDLMVDDGSHFTRETRTCFDALFAAVKVGGCYVIEDWAVGYWRDRDPGYRGMVELVTEIMEQAPRLSIESFMISLKIHQAFAAFRKGAQGWSS